jgi:hypothetical protein
MPQRAYTVARMRREMGMSLSCGEILAPHSDARPRLLAFNFMALVIGRDVLSFRLVSNPNDIRFAIDSGIFYFRR